MTIPGGFVAGNVLTAADMNLLPAGTIGYASTTTNQTGISAVTDLTGLTLTFTAVAGRRYKITGQIRAVQNTTSSNNTLSITDGAGTAANQSVQSIPAGSGLMHYVTAVVVPGAGSKTYKLRLQTGAGTTDTSVGASAPGFILIEDIGI
jgi:hypothetical protein